MTNIGTVNNNRCENLTLIRSETFTPPLFGKSSDFADKIKNTKQETLIAFQDLSRDPKAVESIKAAVKVNEKVKLQKNAFQTTQDVTGAIWSLGQLMNDPKSTKEQKEKARKEIEKQVILYAQSLGQKDVKIVKVEPRDANNLIVLSSQENSRALSGGGFAVDIEYTSTFKGIQLPITARVTAWLTKEFFARVGNPYIDSKGFIKYPDWHPEAGKRKPATFQSIITAGFGEVGLQLEAGFNHDEIMSKHAALSVTGIIRGPSLKEVEDYNRAKKKGERFSKMPSVNGGFILSAKAILGPVMLGPYMELGRKGLNPYYVAGSTRPDQKNKFRPLWLIDPINFSFNPHDIKIIAPYIPKKAKQAIKQGVMTISTQQGISGTIKGASWLLSDGVEILLTKVGEKTLGIASKNILAGAAGRLAGLAGPVGWVIAGGLLALDTYNWHHDEKNEYYKQVKDLVIKGAYKPQEGIAAAFAGMQKEKKYSVGDAAYLMSDVIREAVKQGKATLADLEKQWSKYLNIIYSKKNDSLVARIFVGRVMGRKDIVSANFKQLPFDPNNYLSDDNKLRKEIELNLTSNAGRKYGIFDIPVIGPLIKIFRPERPEVFNGVKKKSEIRLNKIPVKDITYRSYQAQFLGGKAEAIPDFVSQNSQTKWQITATSGDGLTSVFYKTLSKQFSVSDIAPNSALRKTIEDSFQKQRAQFTKTPAYIKPWQGVLYGNLVTAKPLYMLKDGSIMWELTTIKAGKPVKIYESLGLTNQTGYQFDSSDLQDGHIFKIRLDNILSGKEKQ